MRLPLAIQSSDGRSKEFTAEKIVNLYVETGLPTAKSPAVLFNRPGLKEVFTITGGAIRGAITMGDFLYIVSGANVYKVDSGYTATLLGSITGTGPVSMAQNGTQVCIVGDQKGWVATENSLKQITSAAFPGASTVTYLDTFGVFSEPGSGRFFISSQLDFSSFNALDFATAEGDPDDVLAVVSNHRQLWLFGEKTIEVYFNSGEGDFPFRRFQDAVIERGLGARYSPAKEDNTIFFLGDDGLVYRINQLTPQIISTPQIASRIAKFSKAQARGQTMDVEGHKFYILSFPQATLAYDLTTGLWADWETGGSRWTGEVVVRAFGKTLVGDRSAPTFYEADPDTYDDDGTELISVIRYPPVHFDRIRVPIRSIEFDMDSGTATGEREGFAMLRLSNNGRNWTSPRKKSFGKIGEFQKRAIFRRCGLLDRQLHVELSIADVVKKAIIAGHIEIAESTAARP